jgi:hypothetical protein
MLEKRIIDKIDDQCRRNVGHLDATQKLQFGD